MPRRSARLASSAAIPTSSNTPTSNSSLRSKTVKSVTTQASRNANDSKYKDGKPKKKVQKRTQNKHEPTPELPKNVRGRRGALSRIVKMPLDVLYESFMYVTPIEILHLSRTSKALRQILMTRNAVSIWKQARANLVNFPDRPADLNEAQYAALVFDTLCDVRLLKSTHCLRRLTRFSIVTSSKDLVSYGHFVSAAARGEHIVKWNTTYRVCRVAAWKIHEEYSKVPQSAQSSWLKTKLRERRQRIEHGRSVESWLEEQERIRSAEQNAIRERRHEAIKQKLNDLGWEKELKNVSIKDLPAVKQAKELTDHIWEKIKDEIIDALRPERRRLEEAVQLDAQRRRKGILWQRLQDLRSKYFHEKACPEEMFSKLASVDGISELIKAPSSEQVEFSESLLLEKARAWIEQQHSELRSLMDASSTQAQLQRPHGIDPLILATTFFQLPPSRYDLRLRVYPEALSDITHVGHVKLIFADQAFYIAKATLEASGLDPATTTREIVDSDFFLECDECPRLSSGKRCLMAWETGIKHTLQVHGNVQNPRLAKAILTESELEGVKKLVAENMRIMGSFPFNQEFKDLECVRCQPSSPPFVGTASRLKPHIDQA
ncbi:hypothetical protein H0H93_009058, partial [Arthromyces matolae]